MEECPDDKGQDLEVGAVDSIDECIRTIACEHNCSGNLELPCKFPALEVGRGKNEKDIRNRNVATSPTVHTDGMEYVNE